MYICNDSILGKVPLATIDLQGPGNVNLVAGTGSGRANFMGQIVSAYDNLLGAGEFIYLQVPASTAIASGTWVELDFSLEATTNRPLVKAKVWTGGASSGKTLAIAYADFASSTSIQYGWFQISGVAFSKVVATGTWAAGCTVAYSTTGIPQMTPVATKNVINAQGVTAISTQVGVNTGSYAPTNTNGFLLTATQALVFINRPTIAA